VTVADEVPHIVTLDEGVFSHMIRNLMHNAETHGGKDLISMAVTMVLTATHVRSDIATLHVTIINSAGEGHEQSRTLQHQHGLNFLLDTNLAVELVGAKDSTFLGMREICLAGAVLDAAVTVTFEESQVVTSVACPVIVVEREIPLPKEVEGDPGDPIAVPSQAESRTLQPLMYIMCDDDKAPRAMARALLRNPELAATPDSCVLGEHHAEVQSVSESVWHASAAHGALNVVCMFDQNMEWPEGTILGSELLTTLRGSGFNGLIIMRTANDSDSSEQTFLKLGADAVFSKAMGGKLVIPALLELHAEIIQNPNRHTGLVQNATGAD